MDTRAQQYRRHGQPDRGTKVSLKRNLCDLFSKGLREAYAYGMKINRKSNAAILAALAALSLSVPAMAVTNDAPAETATFAQAETMKEITVAEKNGLVKAVEEATKMIDGVKVKEVTIKITTCDEQTFPAEINAKGKINIVGCDVSPSGPGTSHLVKRTAVVPANDEGTVVKSPLTLNGLMGTVPGTLLQAQSSVTVTNSHFFGKSVNGKRVSRLIKGMIDPAKVSEAINVIDVSLYHVSAVNGETAGAKVHVKNVLLHELAEKGRDILAFGPAMGESGQVIIEGCEFDGHFVRDEETPVRIERPNVKVHNNFFYMDAPTTDGGGVRLISPEKDKGLPLKNIEITNNQFLGVVAIENPAGLPLDKDAVKIMNNDFSKATEVLPTMEQNKEHGTVTPANVIVAQDNFWGDLKREHVVADTSKELKAIPEVPALRLVNRIAGETRFETATQVSRQVTPRAGTEVVFLARHDVVADSVSAVPLAQEMKAPILLTPSDSLHEASLKEIKRVKAKKVIIMGGEAAVNKSVEEALVKEGLTVERLAGPNRAATAVETAKKLVEMKKADEFLLVDGGDWQPDLIAGPVAAKEDGATLLTNGEMMAPETEAFLKTLKDAKVTAIGDKAVKTGVAKAKVEGSEPTKLSLDVAKHFFDDLRVLGIASSEDFADALTGGRHIADDEGALILMPSKTPDMVTELLKTNHKIGWITVYGGEARFSKDVVAAFEK